MILTGTPANSRPMKPGDLVEVEITGLGRLTNTIEEWDVDLAGPGEQLQISAQTLHVALAMPEDEAERMVAEGRAGVIRLGRIDHVGLSNPVSVLRETGGEEAGTGRREQPCNSLLQGCSRAVSRPLGRRASPASAVGA